MIEDDNDERRAMNEESLLGNEQPEQSTLQQSVGLYAFTLNYIFGAGVLGIPYAMANGGILVSGLTLVFCSVLSLFSMIWIVETQERARYLKDTRDMVDYAHLCGMFLGSRALVLYENCLVIYVVCSSWMYASIFAGSVANTFPLSAHSGTCDISSHRGPLWSLDNLDCWLDYLVYLVLFALLMGIIVRTDIRNMQGLQLGLTCTGLIAVFTMIVTVLFAMPVDGNAHLDHETKIFNIAQFGNVFGTFVFSQLCHHGVPLLSNLPTNSKVVKPTFVASIGTTTILYLTLGVCCAIFFGVDPTFRSDPKSLNKLIHMNWQNYTAEADTAGVFAGFISYFILMYPAVTCGATFPLYAITLGNNWFTNHRQKYPNVSEDDPIRFRLYTYAMIPPIIAAAFLADISFMLIIVGLCGMIIAFFIPPLLQLASLRQCPNLRHTQHSWVFSAPSFCYFCIAFASVATLFSVAQLFL